MAWLRLAVHSIEIAACTVAAAYARRTRRGRKVHLERTKPVLWVMAAVTMAVSYADADDDGS